MHVPSSGAVSRRHICMSKMHRKHLQRLVNTAQSFHFAHILLLRWLNVCACIYSVVSRRILNACLPQVIYHSYCCGKLGLSRPPPRPPQKLRLKICFNNFYCKMNKMFTVAIKGGSLKELTYRDVKNCSWWQAQQQQFVSVFVVFIGFIGDSVATGLYWSIQQISFPPIEKSCHTHIH